MSNNGTLRSLLTPIDNAGTINSASDGSRTTSAIVMVSSNAPRPAVRMG
jgi:hypothetical protein